MCEDKQGESIKRHTRNIPFVSEESHDTRPLLPFDRGVLLRIEEQLGMIEVLEEVVLLVAVTQEKHFNLSPSIFTETISKGISTCPGVLEQWLQSSSRQTLPLL